MTHLIIQLFPPLSGSVLVLFGFRGPSFFFSVNVVMLSSSFKCSHWRQSGFHRRSYQSEFHFSGMETQTHISHIFHSNFSFIFTPVINATFKPTYTSHIISVCCVVWSHCGKYVQLYSSTCSAQLRFQHNIDSASVEYIYICRLNRICRSFSQQALCGDKDSVVGRFATMKLTRMKILKKVC